MPYRKKNKTSAYRAGVNHAKNKIRLWGKTTGWNKVQRKYAAGEMHDEADARQYSIRASKGAKSSDYYRGQAMEFGMYAHTGKHIK